MSVPHTINLTQHRPVINPDLMDGFVDDPLPRDEAAQIVAWYLPFVDAWSQAGAHQNGYLQARLHISAALGQMLGAEAFIPAVELGAEIWARRNGFDGDESLADWTMDQLFVELATDIDQLLDGAP